MHHVQLASLLISFQNSPRAIKCCVFALGGGLIGLLFTINIINWHNLILDLETVYETDPCAPRSTQ